MNLNLVTDADKSLLVVANKNRTLTEAKHGGNMLIGLTVEIGSRRVLINGNGIILWDKMEVVP